MANGPRAGSGGRPRTAPETEAAGAVADLSIDELVAGGDGLGRHDGQAVFVTGALPGDRVRVELASERQALRGRILELLQPSPLRAEPSCPQFGSCGGCHWLDLQSPAQLAAKEAIFYSALERIGGVARASIPEARSILPSPRALRYRARARLHLASGRLGFRARASHALVEIRECALLQPHLEAAALRLREALRSEGGFPHCADVSLACDSRSVAGAFHLTTLSRSDLERARRLMRRAGLEGAVVAGPDRAVLLDQPVLSWPAPGAAGVTLHGRPDVFAQANPGANALLVEQAARAAAGAEQVLELYAGSGNFTFSLAASGASVVAVEAAGAALDLARRSALEAQAGAVRFIAGDALEVAGALAQEGRRFDTVLLDPPRTGARGIGAACAALGAQRVIYVSCDPATLARDVRELGGQGFRPALALPVDMFPQTAHVEGLCVLERH